jgi:8-oxo-dGTP pyrophosphatase MutT (NUDIX family)
LITPSALRAEMVVSAGPDPHRQLEVAAGVITTTPAAQRHPGLPQPQILGVVVDRLQRLLLGPDQALHPAQPGPSRQLGPVGDPVLPLVSRIYLRPTGEANVRLRPAELHMASRLTGVACPRRPNHPGGMDRQEYYHDAEAPAANSIPPTAFAAVRDDQGRVLLVRRRDSGNWELPGGRVDLGESATAAAEREVVEESGVSIKVTRLAGVYTDPGHIMVYPATGEARQQFAVCFHALPVDGQPEPDHDETCEAAWIHPAQIDTLPIHPSMRLRIVQALNAPNTSHIC